MRRVRDELLARRVEAREAALHLVEASAPAARARRPSPRGSARRSCPRRPPHGSLEALDAPREHAGGVVAGHDREDQRDQPRDQDLALDHADGVVHLVERLREDDHPRRLAAVEDGPGSLGERAATLAMRRRRDIPGAKCLQDESRRRLQLGVRAAGVGDDVGRGRLRGAPGSSSSTGMSSSVTRAPVWSLISARERVELGGGDLTLDRVLERPRIGGRVAFEGIDLLRREVRLELRHDVEVEDDDRRPP